MDVHTDTQLDEQTYSQERHFWEPRLQTLLGITIWNSKTEVTVAYLFGTTIENCLKGQLRNVQILLGTVQVLLLGTVQVLLRTVQVLLRTVQVLLGTVRVLLGTF